MIENVELVLTVLGLVLAVLGLVFAFEMPRRRFVGLFRCGVSKTPLPNLSHEARFILKEASQDRHGIILHLRNTVSGTNIQTNAKNVFAGNVRREVAKWEHALGELTVQGLVVASDQKGEELKVSNLGYQIADMIVL